MIVVVGGCVMEGCVVVYDCGAYAYVQQHMYNYIHQDNTPPVHTSYGHMVNPPLHASQACWSTPTPHPTPTPTTRHLPRQHPRGSLTDCQRPCCIQHCHTGWQQHHPCQSMCCHGAGAWQICCVALCCVHTGVHGGPPGGGGGGAACLFVLWGAVGRLGWAWVRVCACVDLGMVCVYRRFAQPCHSLAFPHPLLCIPTPLCTRFIIGFVIFYMYLYKYQALVEE